MTLIRIVLIDDHPVFRDGLRVALHSVPDVDVVGEAGDGLEGVEVVLRELPDLVLLDLRMPNLNGIEVLRRLHEQAPKVRVLVLTMAEDLESLAAAVAAGARGYLLKGADRESVVRALHSCMAGELVLGAGMTQAFSAVLAANAKHELLRPFPELTSREFDVLKLLAADLPNQAIARRLYVSDKTVRNHVSMILAKLAARDRYQAGEYARNAGVHPPPT